MNGIHSAPEVLAGGAAMSPNWTLRLSELWPDRVAITDPDTGTSYTFEDLRLRSQAVAASLAGIGVRRGDRVAIIMQNGVPVLDLLFGCGQLGAVLVIMNWRLSERELAELVRDAEPSVVVADPEYAELAAAAVSRSRCPDVRLVYGYESLLVAGAATSGEVSDIDVRMEDPWLILYTGGTTGVPKGAVLTHGSIAWNAINTVVSWGLSHQDVAPSFTPMFHTGGLNVFTLPLLMVGGRVILPQSFDPAQALRILQIERPTVLFMVPTMFQLVAEQPAFAGGDLSHLRWAISGGAPLPRVVADAWKAKVPIFKQGYGLTEVGPNNFATSDVDALRGMEQSVGKLTFFARARIVDDWGVDVPDGEPGELLLAGPHMCTGYWRRSEATAQAIRDGWFQTGDIARKDEEGFYYIVDRKKDMIITGGENVYPTEVESVLYEHPAVRQAAVVGLPDPTWGEAVCAVVSLKPGKEAAVEELRDFLRANLARYKVPKEIIIARELPQSGAGKILRGEAKKLIASLPVQKGEKDQ